MRLLAHVPKAISFQPRVLDAPRGSTGSYAAEASATTQLPRPKAEALVSRESDMDWFVPYGIGFGLMVLAIFIGNALFGRKR